MATDATSYTMIDISYIHGNKVQADSYQIVLSRGGPNGTVARGVVSMGIDAFESFLQRTNALQRQIPKV